MNFLGPSFFKFLFGFVGILAIGFIVFFATNYYDMKLAGNENAATVELSR